MRSLKKRFEFIPGSHQPKLMRNGALFLLATGFVFMFAYLGGTVPFWPKGGYTIKAEFETAANVSTKTPVRLRGVKIGKVEKVERRDGADGVVVTMRINDDNGEADLRRDARAHIYWRTLLGFAFYIELEPGAEQAKLEEGGLIPLDRTTAQVELDQVLASLDKPSRAGVQAIFREFDEGFSTQKDSQAGATIENLGPAMKQVGPGVDALRGTQSGDLTRVVRNSSRLMGALARNELQLGQVISNGNTTLGVTAARRAALGQILQNGPATLQDTRTTMVRLRTTLNELDPVAEDLRPGARKLDDASFALRPAVRELSPLLERTNPLLRTLRPAVRRLGAASISGVPLLDRLDPTVDRLNEKTIPLLNRKSDITDMPLYQMIGPTLASVQSSAQQFDSRGHIQRFHALEASENALGFLPCNTNLLQGSTTIDCSDIQAVAGALLGIPPAGAALASTPRTAVRGRKQGPPPAPQADAGTLVKKLANAVGGVL
ncbi:MlaD family protein [Paraconexibacter algicola]|uniref:Mce/MlaD domain-containing protein n=1 Tax=Paraconexibacter algicola TaxID=2133960 RepID=A0A2T4UJY3_9ACTN|nr:MlaD family protein [Paraconexibacter algicola]PTL59553.1 hypothetical protein C7Y72_07780 [Paraconexibacter algicola]